ncbi:hypothetical protein KXD40_008208 [Peronospora effusa]|uniref:Uncharacterized protein n=1 Tax=Peronospora effusa TaxID=542832 RepID=A0A3R7YC79_9STRA|nr:hypothetical protein DD237_001169 [Peronospora effusa]UIZ24017.1 hypothetical protein KXD40_008208 [Peronospora effusa]
MDATSSTFAISDRLMMKQHSHQLIFRVTIDVEDIGDTVANHLCPMANSIKIPDDYGCRGNGSRGSSVSW